MSSISLIDRMDYNEHSFAHKLDGINQRMMTTCDIAISTRIKYVVRVLLYYSLNDDDDDIPSTHPFCLRAVFSSSLLVCHADYRTPHMNNI